MEGGHKARCFCDGGGFEGGVVGLGVGGGGGGLGKEDSVGRCLLWRWCRSLFLLWGRSLGILRFGVLGTFW